MKKEILAALVFMFFVFSWQNHEIILRQNESYVEENTVQKARQLEQVLNESLDHIKMMAYWFGTALEAPEVTPEVLKELEDSTSFNYVRFVNADGMNMASDGRTNDARDREYYIDGMAGNSGISVIEQSRITNETLVNFYTPLRYEGEIIGVLRGVYLAGERMQELLESTFFGVDAAVFLCLPSGTVIASDNGASGNSCDCPDITSYLTDEIYVEQAEKEKVLRAFETGSPVGFTYRSGRETGSGYVVNLECTGWLLVQTFPSEVTGRMYRESMRAGVVLEISLILLFVLYIAVMMRKNRREKKQLLEENQDMDYVIHGARQLFDCFVLADLDSGTYRFLLDGAPSRTGLDEEGSYPKLVSRVLEAARDEAAKKELKEFLDPENLRRELGGTVHDLQLEFPLSKDGDSWMRLNAVCVERQDGIPTKILLENQDITEAKREELERQNTLQTAMEAAKKANRAKSAFLFNMSHDIRTPMNAVIGFANLAEQHYDDPQAVRDYMGKIRKAGDVLLRIINDVLDLARIESGKASLETAPHDIAGAVCGVRDMFAESMEKSGLEFRTEIEVRDCMVLCDELRIEQISINLLSNAQKFTPAGGSVLLRLEQTEKTGEDRAGYRLTVRDSGIGMSSEFMEHMFDAFERERSSTATGIGGTGLGLCIVKNLVDMMDGSIQVESAPGHGTEFVLEFFFPVVQEEKKAGGGQDGPDSGTISGKCVLLAEDNALNREIAVSILENAGMTVETAENGEQAVMMLKNAGAGHFDMILMDIQMPVMDGLEATEKIRRLEDRMLADIPIIAMTANAFDEDRKKTKEAGMDGFVSKPLDVNALWSAMKDVLSGRRDL